MNESTPLPDDERWEQRFRQLSELPTETPPPFFYGRLQGRLTPQQATSWNPIWLQRPAYALGAFSLIVLLNAGALFYYSNAATVTTNDVTTYDDFVADYEPNNSIDYVNE